MLISRRLLPFGLGEFGRFAYAVVQLAQAFADRPAHVCLVPVKQPGDSRLLDADFCADLSLRPASGKDLLEKFFPVHA